MNTRFLCPVILGLALAGLGLSVLAALALLALVAMGVAVIAAPFVVTQAERSEG